MFLEQLKRVKVGETIVEVFARSEPESIGGGLVHIANVVLLSDLFTSLQGDARLHFQHRRVHEDFKFWPKNVRNAISDPRLERRVDFKTTTYWKEAAEAWPQNDDEKAKEMYTDQVETFGCPFAWILGMDSKNVF